MSARRTMASGISGDPIVVPGTIPCDSRRNSFSKSSVQLPRVDRIAREYSKPTRVLLRRLKTWRRDGPGGVPRGAAP